LVFCFTFILANPMKNNHLFFRKQPLLLFLLLLAVKLVAQPVSGKAGHSNFFMPVSHPKFIENKGQYNWYSGKKNNQEIMYGGHAGTFTVLFTTHSVEFVRPVPGREEEEREKRRGERAERKFEVERFSLEWQNTDPAASFTTGEPLDEYFTFPDPAEKQRTIIASGYNTITIKEIYPGINLTYFFPEEGGLKYYFEVAAGADPSLIKGKWLGVKDLHLGAEGAVHFSSGGEKFTDAAPSSYYQVISCRASDVHNPANTVASSFRLQGNAFSFIIPSYDHGRMLVIDPWTSSPGFAVVNKGYDIAQDPTGNIYVYGGMNPYELKKFTSTGVLLWTFSTSAFGYYGDMCLDFVGTPFCIYGPWGDQCVKLTPAGTQVWSVSSGVSNAREIYRIQINPASNLLSVMGMEMPGTGGQVPMVLSIDPATGTYSPSSLHPTSTASEVRGMVVDANGDVYGLSYAAFTSTNTVADNLIWKTTSANAFITSTPDGYNLGEIDASYTDSWFSGFNGMAVGCDLYSFDGVTLNKRDRTTLGVLASVSIPNGAPYRVGGVYTDQCGNVFIGTSNSVNMYDASLTLVTSVATPDTVYDVCAGLGVGEILVCGKGFFGSLTFPPGNCNSSVTTASLPSNGCPCNGVASVSVQQMCVAGNYTYQWLPFGGTNDTATNLCPGTYTVVYTNTSNGAVDSTTVTVTGSSANIAVNAAATNPSCYGYNDGSVTTNPSGGAGPYTYQWTPGNMNTQNVTGLSAGTYTVTATDANGCSGFQVITLTNPAGMSFTLSSQPPYCSACNGSASVTVVGGAPGYSYNWNSSPVQNTPNATNLCSGSYTVSVTDGAGCIQDTMIALVATNPLTLTTSSGPPIACNGDCNGSATAVPANGAGNYTYTWNTNPVQNTATATGLCAGTYIVTVSDTNSCSISDTIVLSEPSALTVQTTSPLSFCEGSCGTLAAAIAGGTPAYSLNWMPGNLNTNNVVVCPPSSLTYTLTVTDASGCSVTDSVQAVVLPLPAIAFTADTLQGCAPLCVNFTNNTPNTSTATWIYGDGNNSGTIPNYCYPAGSFDVSLIVVADNGCSDTLTLSNYINAWPQPVASFMLPPSAPLSEWEPMACFTNTSTGATVWLWNFNDPNDTSSASSPDACHLYSDTGTYCVDLVAISANGCRDTTTNCFEIVPEEATLYVPNAFTPNGEGENNLFMPVGTGIEGNEYHFMVFDRWGMLIYETRTWGDGWDGTYKGNKCQEDVYVWKVECMDDLGYYHDLIGHVSLIR
jgi:gliding motility-associated-like protein